MHFIYFLPGETNVTPAVLAKYGLDSRFKTGYQMRGGRIGVDDDALYGPREGKGVETHGMLVGLGDRVRFDLPAQTWAKVQAAGTSGPQPPADSLSFWLGYWTAEPPTPADLARDRGVVSYMPELGDGHRWAVPILHRYPEGTELPRVLLLDDAGEVQEELDARYRGLFDRAAEFASAYYGAVLGVRTGPPVVLNEQTLPLDVVIEALAVNYRVGRAEVNALRLFTSDNLPWVSQALVDGPRVLDLVHAQLLDDAQKQELEDDRKKKGPDAQADGDGSGTGAAPGDVAAVGEGGS